MGLARLLDKCFTPAQRAEVFTALAEMAMARDLRAIELLLAYTYGKPVQKQEHSGGIEAYIVNIGDDSSTSTT